MFAFIWKLLGRFFFAGYVGNQNAFPKPLSPAEEEACIRLYAEGTETEREAAREKLILHNLRLCAHIAKKYARTGREQDDLVSIGTIGLIKAVNTFSPQKGALSGYASRCIENAILSQRKKRRLRWRNRRLLRQNGACWREWESAAIFCFPMYRVR